MDRTVVLAADRRARCAVEMPARPEPAEETAGEELEHYIGRLAGAPIGLRQGEQGGAPVRILVGARARALVAHEPMSRGLGGFLSPKVIDSGRELLHETRDAVPSDSVQGRLDVLDAQVEYGDRLMGARRTAETYHRTRERDHLKRLVRERDAIVDYIAANPVDGAFHLGGIGEQRGNINNFLLGHLWGVEKI